MGNFVSSQCLKQIEISSRSSTIKLIFFGGATRVLTGTHVAGEIMFEFPDKVVCHADSFFIGRPIPALGMHDELVASETYFVVPIDRLPGGNFTAASLAALRSSPRSAPMNFGECPFQYIRGGSGGVSIKVAPEFIVRLMMEGSGNRENRCGNSTDHGGFLCSTPELKKHYEQLVGSRGQVWSPKLETISEHKIRYSPCRFIGLEWKKKE